MFGGRSPEKPEPSRTLFVWLMILDETIKYVVYNGSFKLQYNEALGIELQRPQINTDCLPKIYQKAYSSNLQSI
jgi:hypothetical protein